MAKKTIVRYKPPNEIIGGRELTVADLKAVGIFTQKKDLFWRRENGFWLDADEAGISSETLAWLKDPANGDERSGHFTVEEQEVEDDEGQEPETVREQTPAEAGLATEPVSGPSSTTKRSTK